MLRDHRRRPGDAWAVVADADDGASRTLAGYLRRLGFWAYPTTRGDEALWLAVTYPLALAVVDVQLEDLTGYELVARLKLRDSQLPVIMTARDRAAESEVRARQAGIVYYAPKPIDLRRLGAVVGQVVPQAMAGSPAAPRSADDD